MSEERLPLRMIVAMTPQRAIGKAGGMPWHLPEDLKRFRALTTGHAIVMGRKTFESIGRALPQRTNIVVTRRATMGDGRPFPDGVSTRASLDEALALARETDPTPIVIGGGEIYRAAMPLATELDVTWVEGSDDAAADTFFPAIDPAIFVEVERVAGATVGVTFARYVRK